MRWRDAGILDGFFVLWMDGGIAIVMVMGNQSRSLASYY